ncbi:hypothetical protein VP01_7309g1 [Puccinia sorghi]|uniref:Uncharacterized protein n=1 Tax=Puccinia sorghi TaxID=27349 RepID=A0A0L6UD00_9BASI|nr:hypothetical protein VP01_7309g1 [Puccinia sorghi]
MLSTYVFTTKIDNMTTSLSNIRKYICIFLHHTIKMFSRMANKPKFGPPRLFATKKFESFNKILRLASIHTNQHSPRRDIAISFVNFQNQWVTTSSLPNDEKEAVPRYLIQTYPGYEFQQIHQLRINSKDVCKKGYFVVVRNTHPAPSFSIKTIRILNAASLSSISGLSP